MATYTVRGYTFTEEQLSGPNPYRNPDGTADWEHIGAFGAFNDAQYRYRLDRMTPEVRAKEEAAMRRWQDKMDSSSSKI